MAGVAHFQVEDGRDFFLSGKVALRPTRGVTIHQEQKSDLGMPPYNYGYTQQVLWECETTDLAHKLRKQYEDSRAVGIRDFNIFFDQIKAPWALVGPPSMTFMMPTLHSNPIWTLSYLRDWIAANCEGEVCLLTSTYKRRISFSSESDFILGSMTFTGTKLF